MKFYIQKEFCLETISGGGWMAEGQTTTRHIPTEKKQNTGLAVLEPKATASPEIVLLRMKAAEN